MKNRRAKKAAEGGINVRRKKTRKTNRFGEELPGVVEISCISNNHNNNV
jgi:hypothetical protein